MLHVRATLALAATVAFVAVSAAQPQPWPPRQPAITPTPLAVLLLHGIDDPNVVAELKLSDEQVKKLAAHRQKEWDDGYTRAAKEVAAAEAARAGAGQGPPGCAANEFLGPMLKRGWVAKYDERLDNRPGRPLDFSLLEAKDVRADVKLTDDQVKALAEVRAKWTKLTADRQTDLSPKDADAQAVS